MCVAHIKRVEMCVGVYLCVTPSNRTEQRVCSAQLGGCACSVRLARWHDPIARARLDWATRAWFAPPSRAAQPSMLGLIPGLIAPRKPLLTEIPYKFAPPLLF